jgi:hypothetical protein
MLAERRDVVEPGLQDRERDSKAVKVPCPAAAPAALRDAVQRVLQSVDIVRCWRATRGYACR